MEARVYAEDPFRNFLPSIGRLVLPTAGRRGRTRGYRCVFEGGEVSHVITIR